MFFALRIRSYAKYAIANVMRNPSKSGHALGAF